MENLAPPPLFNSPNNGIGTRVSRPLPSTRPLTEALRFNHFKNDGKFDHIVKRNIIQDLFRCISGYEDLWGDSDDPDTGKSCFKALDFHRVELEDESFPFPRPFSVRALQVKQIRNHFSRNGDDAKPLETTRKGRKCGRIIPRLQPIYSCKTCFRDASPIICVQCFQHSDHEGHDVAFKTNYNFAPVCDCGALDLYKKPERHSCREHPAADPSDLPRDTFDPGYTDAPDVPQDFKRALYETFVICIEYIIEVFQCAPPPDHYSRLPKDMKELKTTWGQNHTQLHDVAKRAEGPWTVAIFADERHNEPELVRQMAHATGAEYDDCADWVRELDTLGRKVIMTPSSPTVAFHLANMFQQIDVPVSLRHAHDSYQESVASTLLDWVTDICDCHVAGDPDLTTQIMAQVLREDKYARASNHIAPDLRRMLQYKDYTRNVVDRTRVWSRLDWMWLIDSRLWKQPKLTTKALYAKMMTVHPLNMRYMANRFAAHYVTLTQDYLNAERDQDTSLYQFLAYSISSDGNAVQPACEKSDLLITMVEVLEAWYRHVPGDFRDAIPLDPIGPLDTAQREANLRLIGHKNKKGAYLLAHLRSLLELDAVANWVGTTHKLVYRIGQFADLFIGMQPQAHETVHHINFEVDWYKPFNFMSELAKLMRQLGECYKHATFDLIFMVMRFLTGRIYNDICLWSDVHDQDRCLAPAWKKVEVKYSNGAEYPPGTTLNLIEQQLPGVEGFSFHHYNHYLLAQMIESLASSFAFHDRAINFPQTLSMVLATDDDVFESFFYQQREDVALDPEKIMMATLVTIEQPLSKYIVARHIRADRWRRNGSSIRHQLNAYVDVSRRDVTADQEFYLLQAASLMLGPANFVIVVMDRWFCRDTSPPTARYMMNHNDPSGIVTDFEDLLWFLIHLSTDTDRPMQRCIEFMATREIVQLLAIKPMTFGEISKRLSDRIVERVEISTIVRLVADFRGPTETAPGMYTLRPKFLPDIDPFWRHYSRNERKEVLDHLLKKTFEKRSDRSIQFDDWFYIPSKPKLPTKPAPFWNLNGILRSPIAVYVLQVVIEHCVLMEDDKQFLELDADEAQPGIKVEPANIPRFDQLLDIALHFVILALRAEPGAFIPNALSFNGNPVDQMALPTAFSRQVSLYQNLWYIEASNIPVYKPYRSRVQYINRHIRETFSEEVRKEHEEITALKQNPGKDLVPAAAGQMTAAERQKLVMAEFAKKQAAFAANMSFGDDGDEEDAIDMEDDGDDSNESQGPCIVCQDPVTPAQPGGMLALFQPSRIIRETLVDDPTFAEQSLHIPSNFDCATRKLTYARNLKERHHNSQLHDSHPAHSMRLGCYISVCGHYMHESCMDQYSDHTRIRHSHQLHRNQPENVVRYEYMCPLCKSVSNFILPIDFAATPVGAKNSFRVNEEDGRPLTLLEHVRRMSAEGLKHIKDSTKIWQHHTEGGHVKAWFSDFAIPRTAKDTREGDMRGTCHMVDRYRHLVRSLEEQSVALRKVTKKPFYVPEDAVGYTIAVLEIAQRGLARAPGQATVAEQLLDSSRKVIKKLFEELKLELDGVYGKPYNQAGLRVAIFARFLPDWFRASSLPTSLLLRDPLSIVIECAAIAPDVLHAVIIMAYYAELSRALIAASIILRKHQTTWKEWPIAANPFEYDAGPYAAQARARFANFSETAIGMFRNATPYNDVENVLKTVPDALLSKMMYMYTLPFVRRAAIIFYSVHGCYPVSRPEDIITEGCEYDRLGSLLALPDPRITLADKATGIEGTMVLRWLSQWAAGGRQMAATEVPEIYELKFLPKHLDQLILRYGDDDCMKCARAPSFPGLCLFCGELICIGGDCCADDELGECNLHMQICGAATGMFLDVKRCSLIVLFAGTGSFLNAPYLDEHGDPDGGGLKGHRLLLNEQRYEDIRRNAWLNHSIPHLIARKLEGVSDAGGWAAL